MTMRFLPLPETVRVPPSTVLSSALPAYHGESMEITPMLSHDVPM